MEFIINGCELEALCGLPHLQQLAYIRGIRPYMDVKTGISGIKRGISYQSIAEQLYIEPHQGIKSSSCSRAQARRSVHSLERAGLIQIQSEEYQLILNCLLATRAFSVQNKAVTNPSQKAVTFCSEQSLENKGFCDASSEKTVIAEPQKAVTPLIKDNNYIYLLRQFDHFWRLYPEKKSRERAFEIFQQINPDEHLLQTMLQALDKQIKARRAEEAQGNWVPPWKYPANWLAQKSWEDEVRVELKQENRNAKHRPNTATATTDPFWNPEDDTSTCDYEYPSDNIISLHGYRQQ